MNQAVITINLAEFTKFKLWLHEVAGIDLKETKQKLVEGRLAPRLRHYKLNSYAAYFKMITHKHSRTEAQLAVDLLTTNETYFFREPKHFEFLSHALSTHYKHASNFRLWCAASSTGEEPYTLAMLLQDNLINSNWEMIASDINLQVLEKASAGHYPLIRAKDIPKHLLHKYCLKGVGNQEGSFIIDRQLREKVQFKKVNLIEPLPSIGNFDVIFIRNVMIYFNTETRDQVVHKIVSHLKTGGYLFVSHSESLVGISKQLKMVQPSIFVKV